MLAARRAETKALFERRLADGEIPGRDPRTPDPPATA